uniref:Uncharacterized protein n=1 Tax=Anguilla anguilla TaxID=7936 RepID=A0A0E9R893_ANGAN
MVFFVIVFEVQKMCADVYSFKNCAA